MSSSMTFNPLYIQFLMNQIVLALGYRSNPADRGSSRLRVPDGGRKRGESTQPSLHTAGTTLHRKCPGKDDIKVWRSLEYGNNLVEPFQDSCLRGF